MTKVGCNSGPCHGAAAGKNGFKLSLRGYDPDDRLLHAHPPGAGAAHRSDGAGEEPDPAEADAHHFARRRKALRRGLARIQSHFRMARPGNAGSAGFRSRASRKSRCCRARHRCVPGAEQQLIVTAVFSDGRTADVTRWAKYDSGDEGVATRRQPWPRDHARLRRGAGDGVVSEPCHLFAAAHSVPVQARGGGVPEGAAPQLH